MSASPLRRRPIRWLLVLVGAMALSATGCTNTVSRMGVSYNDGLAESFNRLILANILRSAKGYPTYYSAIGDFTGAHTFTADILPEVTAGAGKSVGLDLQPEFTGERQKTVAVSSLETQDFAASMHTRIDSVVFEALIESRDRNHLNLTLTLLVEKVAIPEDEFRYVIDSAGTTCLQRFDLLSAAEKGMCRFVTSEHGAETCYDTKRARSAGRGAYTLILLTNDPTNACLYAAFRIFVEAFALNDPHIRIEADGRTLIALGDVSSGRVLFQVPGAGLALRSPHEIIAYLGQVVHQSFTGGSGYLVLTDPQGASVPLFLVEAGTSKDAQISARVNGVVYSVPDAGFAAATAISPAARCRSSRTSSPSTPPRPSYHGSRQSSSAAREFADLPSGYDLEIRGGRPRRP